MLSKPTILSLLRLHFSLSPLFQMDYIQIGLLLHLQNDKHETLKEANSFQAFASMSFNLLSHTTFNVAFRLTGTSMTSFNSLIHRLTIVVSTLLYCQIYGSTLLYCRSAVLLLPLPDLRSSILEHARRFRHKHLYSCYVYIFKCIFGRYASINACDKASVACVL